MRGLATIYLTVLLTVLTGCASLKVDPAISRPNLQAQAAPFIDLALSRPVPDLYSATEAGDALAGFHYSLALMAGRGLEPTPQDLADFATLDVAKRRLLPDTAERQGAGLAVDVPLLLTADEQQALDRVVHRWSADYWFQRAIMATTTHTTMIYQPPVRLGGVGSVMPLTLSEQVIPFGVAMTAAHCAHAVRIGAGFPPVEPPQVGVLRPLSIGPFDMEASLDAEVKTDDPAREWYAGPAACGSDAQYLAYIRQRQGR